MERKPVFVTLKTSDKALDGSGNVVVLSVVRIDQTEGDKVLSSSHHLVIKKFRTNVDGSQSGQTRQLFLPLKMKESLIDLLSSFDVV